MLKQPEPTFEHRRGKYQNVHISECHKGGEYFKIYVDEGAATNAMDGKMDWNEIQNSWDK